MKSSRIAARTVGAIAIAVGTVFGTTAIAHADQAPRISLMGDDIDVIGDNSGCRGIVRASLETDPAHREQATLVLAPLGMNGVGPGWDSNPNCRFELTANWLDGIAPNSHIATIPFNVSREPQAPVRIDLRVGSGLTLFNVFPSPGAPITKGVSWYAIIP